MSDETAGRTVGDAFVHLHNHSEHSPLDGIDEPATLIRAAGHLGQPAIAITDHGRVSATAEFWQGIGWYNSTHAERHAFSEKDCKKANCHPVSACRDLERCPKRYIEDTESVHGTLAPIKGILGLEAYIADKSRTNREKGDYNHLTILAIDDAGWRNLRLLASKAYLEGFYQYPRIDLELLEMHREGLIVLSACLGGHIAKRLRAQGEDDADALIREYERIMGKGNYFLELQWHNDQTVDGPDHEREQWDFNRYLVAASARTGVPLAMTNDAHYALRSSAADEGYVLAIQQRTTTVELAEKAARGERVAWLGTPDFYIKSRKEMAAAMADWLRNAEKYDPALAEIIRRDGRSWLDRTVEIGERAALREPFPSGLHFPEFPTKNGESAEEAFSNLVWERAPERYPSMDEKTRRLIAYETQIIADLQYAAYFLITADFCDFARSVEVEVGLGRGSAPGSIVTYVLGITDVDPIHYKLSEGGIGMTRFLNPSVFYGIRPDAFGALPSAFAADALEALSAEEMEAELAAELTRRSKAVDAAYNAGTQIADPFSGEPIDAAHLAAARARWATFRVALRDEWVQIKKWGVSNEKLAGGQKTPPEFGRGAMVEALWRWRRAVDAGAPAGTENEVQSLVARFLGITTREVMLLDDGTPLLPTYEVRPSRKSMPDIDIDFEPGDAGSGVGKDKVVQYVVRKYGEDHVSQINTFSTLAGKAALTDVARSKGFPFDEAKELTRLLPNKMPGKSEDENPDGTDERMLITLIEDDHPEVVKLATPLRERMAADPQVDEIVRQAARLEGIKRQDGIHACGWLITPRPVLDYVPVRADDKGRIVAVFDGPTVDRLGLLKVDFLVIKNLSINAACVARVRERRGIEVNWRTVPDNDPGAMKMANSGRTLGIFQFSSGFATQILKSIKPRTVDDLMVATALGRPGPMAYIPNYIEGRARGGGVYGDPVFERFAKPVLEETYGVLVYQEQVMRLAVELADFTLTESDGLRKATAKKDKVLLAAFRSQFVEAAVSKGVDRAFIEHWWDNVLAPFAQYSFNRSHSTAYALMAYKQLYLKAHYTPEFVAGLMSIELYEKSKSAAGPDAERPLAAAVREAHRLGFAVTPIDINHSTDRVEIEDASDGTVAMRMSFAAIKGVSEKAIGPIIVERNANGPFASVRDIITRLVEIEKIKDPDTGRSIPNPVGKTALLGLAKVGALDGFGHRSSIVARIEEYFGTTSVKKRSAIELDSLPPAPASPPREFADWEHELLGFNLATHPAEAIPQEVRDEATDECEILAGYEGGRAGETMILVGVAEKAAVKTSQKGNEYLAGKVSDGTAVVDWMWFSGGRATAEERKEFEAAREAIREGRANGEGIVLRGEPKHDERGNKLFVRGGRVVPLPRSAVVEEAVAKVADPTVVAPTPEQVADGLDSLFG